MLHFGDSADQIAGSQEQPEMPRRFDADALGDLDWVIVEDVDAYPGLEWPHARAGGADRLGLVGLHAPPPRLRAAARARHLRVDLVRDRPHATRLEQDVALLAALAVGAGCRAVAPGDAGGILHLLSAEASEPCRDLDRDL